MSTLTWRRLLLTLNTFAVLQLGVCSWMQEVHFAAMPGFAVPFFGPAPDANSVQQVPTKIPGVSRLTFPASSPLAQAGIRSGDLLDLRAASPAQNYRWATGFWWAGEHFLATIITGRSIKHVTLTAQWLPLRWYGRLANLGLLWMLVFAGILAWRRADNREARTLALLLMLLNIGLNFQAQNWITPWPAWDVAIDSLSGPIYALGIVLLATYAMLFTRPANALSRVLARASYAAAVAGSFWFLMWPLAVAFRLPFIDALSRSQQSDVTSGVLYGLPLLCLLATVPQTRGAERARIAWASVSLVPYYLLYTIPSSVVSDTAAQFLLYADNVVLFVVPLGLTYSLLSRRLLDIDFALNRAAVFAVTSLLLAGLFAALQWIANAFLTGVIPVHNAVVEMMIVVIVFYVVRFSRRSTDGLVTRLLFAARNRRLQVLRELPNMVDEISDAQAIAPLTMEYLRTRAVIAARVFLQGAEGEFVPAGDAIAPSPIISRNDVAVIALRSRREAVTEPEWSELGVAFPMVVRGQVRGILFCQPPQDGAFAPDEMQVLQELANRMAADRDDLLAASLRRENDALRNELTELRTHLNALTYASTTMPAKIDCDPSMTG